eukprot:scaffold69150_cov21-Phaeocystis_antarctica.AAC.1
MAAGGCHPTPGRAAGCEVCVQGWFSGRLVPARATQENGSPALALAHYLLFGGQVLAGRRPLFTTQAKEKTSRISRCRSRRAWRVGHAIK